MVSNTPGDAPWGLLAPDVNCMQCMSAVLCLSRLTENFPGNFPGNIPGNMPGNCVIVVLYYICTFLQPQVLNFRIGKSSLQTQGMPNFIKAYDLWYVEAWKTWWWDDRQQSIWADDTVGTVASYYYFCVRSRTRIIVRWVLPSSTQRTSWGLKFAKLKISSSLGLAKYPVPVADEWVRTVVSSVRGVSMGV